MRNQNIVLTRDQLLEDIWGYDFDGETRTVDVHVRTLRQKLGEKRRYYQDCTGSRLQNRRRQWKAKIQRSMLLVLFVTILIFYGLLTLVMYQKNLTLLKEEVNQEARYIRTAVDISGPAYLKEMDGVDIKTRVTRISTEGKVLYDSGNDAETLENHSKRPEVKEALASGTGEDVRVSGTVGKEMYYYAILLQDGSVLRVAKTMDNLGAMARDTLPVIGVLAVVMMIFAWILGRWQTERLIRPINELDIEHPLENVVYEELRPLLTAMDRRNKEKAAVEDMKKSFPQMSLTN